MLCVCHTSFTLTAPFAKIVFSETPLHRENAAYFSREKEQSQRLNTHFDFAQIYKQAAYLPAWILIQILI